MTAVNDVVFSLDVDNTLLDNDHVQDDLRNQLERDFGAARMNRYWAIFEALRAELGYADCLGALQRFRCAETGAGVNDPRMLLLSSFLLDYPFANRLYPGALDALAHLREGTEAFAKSWSDLMYRIAAKSEVQAKARLA